MSEAGRASKAGLSDETVAARHVQGGLSILSGSLGLMTLFIAGAPLTVAAPGKYHRSRSRLGIC